MKYFGLHDADPAPVHKAPAPVRRFSWVVTGLLIIFAALALRLVQIQVLNHDDFRKTASGQYRGRILDRNGVPLVHDYLGWNLCMRVDCSPRARQRRAALVADALGLELRDILDRMRAVKKTWFQVARGIRQPSIVDLARKHGDWLSLDATTIRLQPAFPLAEGLLGRFGSPKNLRQDRHLVGLEAALNPVLQGKDACLEGFRDGRCIQLSLEEENRVIDPGHGGADVYLTLDKEVQEVAERVLDSVMEKYSPRPGAGAVVLDAWSGEVLALASRPCSPDLRQWPYVRSQEQRGLEDVQWMIPLTYAVPPGSTFKPFTVGEALSGANPRRLTDIVDCGHPEGTRGPVMIGRRGVRNYKHKRHGNVSVERALMASYNVGMARLADQMGLERMAGLLGRIGFEERGGCYSLALPGVWSRLGKEPGSTAPTGLWRKGYTAVSWSFGQEMRMTLMDLAYAYTAIATDGTLRPPVLTRKVTHPAGNRGSPRWLEQTPERRVLFTPGVAARLRGVLRKVIEVKGGTLNRLYREQRSLFGGHAMGAKTGTATVEDPAIRNRLDQAAGKKHSENILSLVVIGPVGEGFARYIVALTAPHPRCKTGRKTISAGRVLGQCGVEIMRFLLDRDRVRT